MALSFVSFFLQRKFFLFFSVSDYMDNKLDCSMQGFIDIPSDVHIVVTLRGSAQKVFDAQRCELRFQAQNKREFIKVEFEKFYISSCRVTFSVNRVSIIL